MKMKMDFSFKPELNLKELTLRGFTRFLWDLPTVKSQIKNCFQYYSDPKNYKNIKSKWNKIRQNVVDLYKQIPIQVVLTSTVIETEVIEQIHNIGQKLFNWFAYFMRLGEGHIEIEDIVQKTVFCNIGTVDEKKTFCIFAKKHLKTFLKYSHSETKKKIYLFLCIFAYENFNKWDDIASKVKWNMWNYLLFPDFDNDYEYQAIALTLFKHFQPKEWKELVKKHRTSDDYVNSGRFIGSQEMLEICAEAGLLEAAKYFVKTFSRSEDEEDFLDAAERSFQKLKSLPENRQHEKEKHIELILYLLNKPPEPKQTDFISKHKIEFLKYLTIWPFDYYYMRVFEKLKGTLTENDFVSLIDHLISQILEVYPDGIYFTKRRALLQTTWNKLTESNKISVILNSKNLVKLLNIPDFDLIKIFLNIENWPEKKTFWKTEIFKTILVWSKTGKQKLQTFFEKAFLSKEKSDNFKKMYFD